VLDIPGRDWVLDRERVLARIEAALAGADEFANEPADDAAPLLESVVPAAAADAPQATAPAAPAAEPPAAGETAWDAVRHLISLQGTSRKFWRAARRGTELQVTYGRIGSNGQVVLKQFDSLDRARREMDKLVEEKLRKGYSEEAAP